MSNRKVHIIACDEIECPQVVSANTLREAAMKGAQQGWIFLFHRDYCPEHNPTISEKPKPEAAVSL